MRIGIYGGSFDPVHLGHLLVAETVREQVGLDKVLFIPAYQSPLKLEYPPIPGQARLEMLRIAIGGHTAFEIDDRELKRGGTSYTVDTLRELIADRPDHEWFLLMGADSLIELDRWKEPSQLCQLAMPIVVARGGYLLPDLEIFQKFVDAARMTEIRRWVVQMPQIEISSRDLRLRIQDHRSIRYQVPAGVDAYVRSHQLYREKC